MTSQALRATPRRLRRRPLAQRRTRRAVAVNTELLSVAGMVGSRAYDRSGAHAGFLDDLVIRWDSGEAHPPLWGAVIRVRRARTFVPVAAIASLEADRLLLAGALEQRPPEREPGLVALAHDVLDRQIVDVDGADIVRVSDLVLGRLHDGIRLVGVDASTRTLLRRLGPAALRRKVAVERVYDWGAIAAFSVRGAGEAGSVMKLTNAAAELRALHPAELKSLLIDLPPHERDQLAAGVVAEPKP